jgi:iron complex transport system substrate-binding protein
VVQRLYRSIKLFLQRVFWHLGRRVQIKRGVHRAFRLSLLATLTFLLVSACNGNVAQNPAHPSSQSPTAECRTIEHAMGEACVPTNPQRVIVLDISSLDAALALGVKPVGSTIFAPYTSYRKEQTQGIETVGDYYQPNIEKILLLKPDLILDCRGLDERQVYEKLSQIAPTVSVSLEDCSEEWKDGFKTYAQALGKTEAAEQLLHNYDERIQEFQRQMGDRLKKTEASVVVSAPQYVRIYLKDSFLSSVIEEAGLPRPPEQDISGFTKEISLEALSVADGDVMFVMDLNPQDSSLQKIMQNPLWSQLNAVKQGRVYPVNYNSWIAERSIGGANRILDDLFKYLVKESRS